MSHDLDPSLMQDFLTEAGELIEKLDADLVKLESSTGDEQAELLNSIFRALHTVKGAAGFLNLGVVTTFAHAAEDALNRLRQGDVAVTQAIMDTLLKSVDVLRGMVEALSAGEQPAECPKQLIDSLHVIAGAAASAPAHAEVHAAVVVSATVDVRPLSLPPQKEALLEFMVSDLTDSASLITNALSTARHEPTRKQASEQLEDVCEALTRTLEFFELAELVHLMHATGKAVSALTHPEAAVDQIIDKVGSIAGLISEQAESLKNKTVKPVATDELVEHLTQLASPGSLPAVEAAAPQPGPAAEAAAAETADDDRRTGDDRRQGDRRTTAPVAEQTIRVEVGRLEALLNLVGQLVLNKNRFLGLTRRLRDLKLPHETMEDLVGAANELDRLTGNLQVGIMRTRMQPMAKLFERYPRVIRDVARVTNKKINLEIVGKDTEVDKSVLELLADPLVHILRNSADHGIESPEKRLAAGKPETGTIKLSAQHQGSHVRIEIKDDGKGIDRDVIARKAVEKGLATQAEVDAMTEEQVIQFIFAPGFSTAEKVTDLSGRGVGMDVVRTNIAKINGTVGVSTVKGQGTTIEVLIPLTVAIMPAMVVGVGKHLYAVPLSNITEIVRPETTQVHSVAGAPVMKLRETVLPLIDMRQALHEPQVANGGKFAVVVAVGNQRAGLVVDRLVGQQEVVIKSLDDSYTAGGPFSGATIREDGDVSLILDVIRLLRDARAPLNAAA